MLFQMLGIWLLAPEAVALAGSIPRGRYVRRDHSSGNWCGQVLYGKDFRDVSASWVMPESSPLPAQYSVQPIYNYQWVGIDGATASCQAILQAGTYATMQNNALSYGFWYEFYPKDSWLMDEPDVSPGDSVFVQVKAHNTTSGYAYMKNLSTGKDITINLEAPAGSSLCGSTAEWIQENATGGNSGDAGLAPFNTFSFDYCHALDVSGNNYNLQGSEKWFMQPNGNTICYPSNVLGGSVQINYNGPRA